MKRGRVLPDFTAISSQERTILPDDLSSHGEQSPEDVALVSAVRATLAITEAQVKNAQERAALEPEAKTADGDRSTGEKDTIGLPLNPIDKPQVSRELASHTCFPDVLRHLESCVS